MIRYICCMCLLAASSALAVTESPGGPAEASPDHAYRVQDFGAVGDGTTLDTAAIQKAIDACSAAGGGRVCLTPGVYLSGTIFLKDNVRLVLETNAVLRGSPRPEDYPLVARKNPSLPTFDVAGSAGGGFLVFAEGIKNASIEGRGTIDGQGTEFWFEEMLSGWVRKPMPDRPRALVALVDCESLLFRDVNLINSPCYTLWLVGCDHVNVDGISIRNPHKGPNTDGIDIDCCNDVRIANCYVDGGDDAIAIKSDGTLLGKDKPCENITVTNCVLRSVPACGVRIGYEGDSVIRDCTFSNLTIFGTDIGLDILSILPGRFLILKGTRCENITFNNIVMRDVTQPIYFWMGNNTDKEARVHLKNILVSNIIAHSRYGSYIGGFDKEQCENVTLSNMQFILTGEMPEGPPPPAAGVWGCPMNPYAIHCTQVDGLRIQDIDIDFRQARGAWRYGVYCSEVSNASLRGIRTRGLAALPALGAIGFRKTSASVRDCDAEADIGTFLHATESSRVFVSGCDWSRAKKGTALDESSKMVTSGVGRN